MDKNELIYREGDPHDEVFFIIKGSITLMNSKGHELMTIREGEMFGEIEVFHEIKRQNFAATKTDVLLLMCKSSHFLYLTHMYHTVQKYIKKLIKTRTNKIKKSE